MCKKHKESVLPVKTFFSELTAVMVNDHLQTYGHMDNGHTGS